MIPLQVIENVDLVLGKRTLVRTELNYLPGNQGNQEATTKVFLDGKPQGENTITLTGGANNSDVFFLPQQEGQDLNLSVQVESTIPGFQTVNVSTLVNVTKTREFKSQK